MITQQMRREHRNRKRKKHLQLLKKLKIEQFTHNKVKYRTIPGLPGKYPYREMPINVVEEYTQGRQQRLQQKIRKIKEAKLAKSLHPLVEFIKGHGSSNIKVNVDGI